MPPWLLLQLVVLVVANAGSCPQEPCSPCFQTEGRQEIHSLSSESRKMVATTFRAFKYAQSLYKNKKLMSNWTSLSDSSVCFTVKMLDSMLKPGMLFPFWDSRIEERMSNPRDSPLFTGRFFPDKTQRKRRKIRDRRTRSEISSLPHMSTSLIVALRAGRHAQLLSFMHAMGFKMRPFVNDSCTSLCSRASEFTTCSRDVCWSKIRSGAVCSENSPSLCYNSVCINGVCSVPTRRKSQNVPVAEAYPSIGDEQLAIISLPDREVKIPEIEGSGEESTEKSLTASNVYYSVMTAPPTTETPIRSTTKIAPVVYKETLDFDDDASFPTVYFPITIVKRKLSRRYIGYDRPITVSTKGANLPNGYTQKIAGKQMNTTRAVVRVLDPKLAPIAVDAQIIVMQGNHPCDGYCNIEGQGYKPCNNTVRISRTKRISDPIKWFKHVDAIPWKWTGSGYYRRPEPDYLMFKCN